MYLDYIYTMVEFLIKGIILFLIFIFVVVPIAVGIIILDIREAKKRKIK